MQTQSNCENTFDIQLKPLYYGFVFTGKFVPVAYGIQKLQIACVVEDDKIGTDFLEEKIMEFEDFVSSCVFETTLCLWQLSLHFTYLFQIL